ncbi:MAG: LysR family transcriptional regulator [Beijerinckiaceae bacterium]|jgi:DNA-binding transcriptional LysR family regulator|nr:LysR family transcriptional regulator [Beijerinckiaceae bacterium]
MLRHDMTSLRLFVAICEYRNLSRAAESMNLALSAASRRLKLMEQEVGAPLVRRLPHGFEPTAAGFSVFRYAQMVLHLGDQLSASIADLGAGVRGRVRVFASSSALVQRLAADLAAFAREHPEIRIDLEERPTADTLEALDRKIADIGVIVRGAPLTGLVTYPYTKDRLGVAVHKASRFAKAEGVTLGDLLEEDFVALDVGTAVYRLIDEKVRALGQILKVRVQVRSFEVMCQMVAHGLGIGILPEAALRPLAEALGIALVRLDEPWAERDLDLVTAADREPNEATSLLIRTLRKPLVAH